MMIGIGSGPMGDLIGIDYFHLVAGFFNVVGLVYFLAILLFRCSVDGSSMASVFKGLGPTPVVFGCLSAGVYLLGSIAANYGLVEVGYRPALAFDQIGGSVAMIALGILVAIVPGLTRRYEDWLDRKYPRAND